MADNETKVTLHALFKETGLDRFTRNFQDLNRRVMDWTRGLKGWSQAAGPSREDLQRQTQAGLEVERHQGRVERLKRMWHETGDKIERAHDPRRIQRLQQHQDRFLKSMVEEQRIVDGLNRSSSQAGANLAMGGLLRRGMRLGLGVMGLPMTLGAAARGGQEAYQQEMGVAALAARTREMNTPMQTFSEHVVNLRRDIVAAGAEFGYAGREAIMLQDSLSQMSGGLMNMREVFNMSRGLGMQPQVAGQLLAYTRRFGAGGGAGDKETAKAFAATLRESGMMPRGGEMAQAIIQAMQTYSTRLPSVSPETLSGIFSSLSAEGTANKPGVGRLAPTLRGQGGTQVVQGLTAMMDDWSEAMVATQSEALNKMMKEDPDAFKGTLKTLGMTPGEAQGEGRFALLSALKSAGVADSDGLKFAGRTIKDITQGMSKGMELAILPQLIRGISPQIAAALVQGGFIEKLKAGTMTEDQFAAKVQQMTAGAEMNAPGLAFAHLGRSLSAGIAGGMERGILKPAAPWAEALAQMFDEDKIGTAFAAPGMAVYGGIYGMGRATMKGYEDKSWKGRGGRLGLFGAGLTTAGLAMSATGVGAGIGGPMALAGGAMLAAGAGMYALGDGPGKTGKSVSHGGRITVDVNVNSSRGMHGWASDLASIIGNMIQRDTDKALNGEPMGNEGKKQSDANAAQVHHR
jgi:hypothetical protein